MLSEHQLQDLVTNPELSRRDRVLLVLAVSDPTSKQLGDIRAIGERAGIRQMSKWNLSDLLARSYPLAVKTTAGWELSKEGKFHIRGIAAEGKINLVVTTVSHSLRAHLEKIQQAETMGFAHEAIACLEAHQYRAAVVFSWVGAMSLLYHHVSACSLSAFNTEAKRRDQKWREAKNSDDLGRMKEHDFLNIIESLGIIGRSVKATLQSHCLQLRNACGHPNSLAIAENTAAAHIEKLILNVYSKY